MNTVSVASLPFNRSFDVQVPFGTRVSDMVHKLARGFDVVVFIRCEAGAKQQWVELPQSMWKWTKPKGENVIRLELYPAGGKSGQTFAIIAAIAISVAAPYLASALFPTLAAGSFGLALATTAIAVGGNLLVAKLFPASNGPSQQPKEEQAQQAVANVDSDQNILGKDLPPPAVLGLSRISPYDIMQPHQYLKNGRDVIERVFEFSGKHALTDIQMNGVAADSLPGLEVEVKDGSDGQQSLVTKVAKTKGVNSDFSKFLTISGSRNLTNQANPETSVPTPIAVSPGYHEKMEQYTLRWVFEPFVNQASETANVAVHYRILLRNKATDAVINLPEIRISGRTLTQKQKEIHLRWDDQFQAVSASSDFQYVFYHTVPAASGTLHDASTGAQWEADSHFEASSTITDTQNISGQLDSINVRLDPVLHPKVDYEIEVTQSLVTKASDLNTSSYEIGGDVVSLFKAVDDGGVWKIPADLDGLSGGANFAFTAMVVNSRPVQRPGNAHIAIRATSIPSRNLTCKAQRYFSDWNGSIWTGSVLSKNPAVIYRGVMAEWLAFSRVSLNMIANDDFVAWRQECIDEGYECSFIATGQSVSDVFDQIATAGFANKRFGWGMGVDYYRDRRDEVAMLSFSHRDSKISAKFVNAPIPKGFRVKFRDEANDWQEDEFDFNHPFGSTTVDAYEPREYASISNRDQLIKRILLDMLEPVHRRRVWTIQTGPAGFNRKKGDMINVVTDLFTERAHGFFVRQVLDKNTIAVDRDVPVYDGETFADIDDVSLIEDLYSVGLVSVANLVAPGGMEEYTLSNVSGNIIRFEEDIPASWTVGGKTWVRDELAGTRLTVAARSDLFTRCIVYDVKRQDNQRAIITAVDAGDAITDEIERYYQK